jgi:rare lipoprotein A
VIPPGEPIPKGGGSYKVGIPYTIDGLRYTPAEDPGYDRVGIGSFYSEAFHGRRTANGEIFDMWALTAAHPTLPMPSYAYVTNLANDRTVLVRINDRGPYARGRVVDLSRAAARLLGFEMQGTAQVRVRYAGRAPLNGDDGRERRFLLTQRWYRIAAWGAGPPLAR